MPGPVKKQVRRVVRGDYIRVGDNVNIDRVAGIQQMKDPEDGLILTLVPIDGSEAYPQPFPDPTQYVEVGWSATIGLPVTLMCDDRGNVVAEVDWGDTTKALSEDQAADAPGLIALVESWLDHHEVLPVSFPKGRRPVERCPKCGSPVSVWYDPLPDGDVEPRSECLVSGCYGSTV